MKNTVYLDTSVISAYFDKRTPERMEQTVNAWSRLGDYRVFLSETVIEEMGERAFSPARPNA